MSTPYSFTMDESVTAVHQTPASQVPNRQILDIIIHHWGVDGQSITDVVDFLSGDNSHQSSAHFVAHEGYVYCIVSPENVAWDAGNWQENVDSIGIECHPEMTDGDIDTVAQLIAWLWTVYGKTNLKKHSDIVSTDCPGRWAGEMGDLASRVEAYYLQFTNQNGDDMFTDQDRALLVKMAGEVDALKAAVFDGGLSMPEGKPMKDEIHDQFDTVRRELSAIATKVGAV